jgi:hypothetical protein
VFGVGAAGGVEVDCAAADTVVAAKIAAVTDHLSKFIVTPE